MVVNEKDVRNFFVSLFPSRHGAYIVDKIQTIQEKIGFWLRGQVVLMCLMFTLSLTGLLILGIDNALTLAMMTGIAELLPDRLPPRARGFSRFQRVPYRHLGLGLIF